MKEFSEYQHLAMRTSRTDQKIVDKLINASLGLAGESGEFCDMIKKWQFQGHTICDMNELLLELGDILWYITLAAEALDSDLEEIAIMNIEKLESRYKENKFNAEESINREV